MFISIDDNEQAQLKLLCDEVFKQDSLFFQSLGKNAHHRMRDTIGSIHERILCYVSKAENVKTSI